MTLSPRQPVTAVPYSLATRGLSVSQTGEVGVSSSSADPYATGLWAVQYGPSGIGVRGDGRVGVYGSGDTGIHGEGSATEGSIGILGRSWANSGTGVHGAAYAATGETYGIYGTVDSPEGYAGFFDGRGYFSGSLGIGKAPLTKLDVDGVARVMGFQLPTGAAAGRVLTCDASGVGTWQAPSGGGPWQTSNGNIYYSAGNVGIGTSTPQARLHVGGDAFLDGWLQIGRAGAPARMEISSNDDAPFEWGGLRIQRASDHTRFLYLGFDSGDFGYIQSVHSGVAYRPLGLNPLGGNVGIGTGTPSSRLTVQNGDIEISSDAYLAFLPTDAFTSDGKRVCSYGLGWVDFPSTPEPELVVSSFGGLRLFSGSYERMRIDAYGRVGIGTNGPHERLTINGRLAFTQANGDQVDAGKIEYRGSFDPGCLSIVGAGASVGSRWVRLFDNIKVDHVMRSGIVEITGGSDLAEPFDVALGNSSGAAPGPGMLVVVDPDKPGKLMVAEEPYDRRLAGVISGANGLSPGLVMKSEGCEHADGSFPVAMVGRVWCYATATGGPIAPGDLLTSSSVPGHAMRMADDAEALRGCIIGKAMSALKAGEGLVLVLAQPQ